MSEAQVLTAMTDGELKAAVGMASPGNLLREARQAAGVHIAALAVSLKVPVSKLEALEADNFSALPDAVFVRALACSVCRSLKIDPVPVLALMPQGETPRLAIDNAGINATFKDRSVNARSISFVSQAAHPVFLAVLALLVGAVVLAFLPRNPDESVKSIENTPLSPAESVQSVVASPDLVIPVETSSRPAGADMEREATAASAVPSAAPVVAQVPMPAESAATTASVSVSMVAAPADILVFRAHNPSWVQVRDASGVIVLERTLAAGESATVSGKLPLSVVVGRMDATEVLVRGKPYDLAAVTRENVARFEVTQ